MMGTSALPFAPDGWFSAALVPAGTDSEEGLLSCMATVKHGRKSPLRQRLSGSYMGS